MHNSKIPKIGMRTIKTSIAVLLCMLIFKLLFVLSGYIPNDETQTNIVLNFLLERENPIFACIAAIVVMQTTFKDSVELSSSRIWGTAIGAYFGLAFLWIDSNVLNRKLNILFTFIGVIAIIFFCNLIKKSYSISIALVTFLIIMITVDQVEPYLYAANRIIDTAIGICISLLVNYFVRIPHKKKASISIDTVVADEGTQGTEQEDENK
ncbi:MAG: hypothetical protein GX824_07955 [Clostridiales bacterium]|nr:hypothetical protein [Clostridiales bacterium]